MRHTLRNWLYTLGAVAVLFLVLGIIGAVTDPPPANPEPSTTGTPRPATEADQRGALDDLSLAGRLAVIHNNRGPVMPSDAVIERFERVLLDLDAKCPETQAEIADMGVFAQRQLADAGRDETLLDVFGAASNGIPVEAAGVVTCAEVFATLLTMLTP